MKIQPFIVKTGSDIVPQQLRAAHFIHFDGTMFRCLAITDPVFCIRMKGSHTHMEVTACDTELKAKDY